jgi:peptide/nickel transport system permease protein
MPRYWIHRIIEIIPLLIGISLLSFTVFWLTPGDPIALVVDPTLLSESERAAVRDQLGLNDSFPIRYAKMMRGLVNGDLRSFRSKQPTYQVVRDAFPTTFIISALGLGLAILIALLLGVLAARRPRGPVDRGLSLSLTTSLAVPSFVLALLLVRLFTEQWHLLPSAGIAPRGTTGFHPRASLPYLVMPTIVVAVGAAPILARYLRDALIGVLGEDYIRTARAKGLAEPAVLARHALRNSLIGVVSLLNTIIPVTLGGSVIVETIFGLPGLGKATTTAALSRDYPVVLTNVMFVAVLTVITNLIVDFVYGMLDPRIRLQS